MSAAQGRRGTTVKTPARLKLVEGRGNGRDSGGRLVKPAPSFVRLPPACPDFLHGAAREEWDRVVPELARLELAKPIDGASLTAYCLAWQRLVDAQRLIDEEGLTSRTAQGVGVAPWVRVVEGASKELRAWAHEFGLTPASEGNVSAGGGVSDDDDPFSG